MSGIFTNPPVDPDAGVAGLRTLGTDPTQAMPGDATPPPAAHASEHNDGGGDPITDLDASVISTGTMDAARLPTAAGATAGILTPDTPPALGGATPAAAVFSALTADRHIVPSSGVTLANGDNHDVAIGNAGRVRVTGPSAAYAVTGFAGGVDGRKLSLLNNVAQTLTIKNEDAGSTAANRILTLTGADVALRTDAKSAVSFEYDGSLSRWVLTSSN